MRTVVLGKSNLEVSAIGFGGIPIQRLNRPGAVRVVRHALDLGVNFIDTAAAYGDSERKIGEAIEGRSDGLVIASKTLAPDREGALKDVENSRRALGVEVIDLYQLHSVSDPQKWQTVSGAGGALEGLQVARDRGHIAHIGVTSHSLDLAFDLIEQPVFETVQFPFNLVTSEPADEIIPRSLDNDLGFIVMKPLCGGQFGDAELAFKFLNGYPDLVPIPGIEREQEIAQIVSLVESGARLEGEEKRRADEIVARLGKRFCRRCGYCEPCPQGVPVRRAMIFDGLAARLPAERVKNSIAPAVAEGTAKCTECGQCETRCPYDLNIIEVLKGVHERAKQLAAT